MLSKLRCLILPLVCAIVVAVSLVPGPAGVSAQAKLPYGPVPVNCERACLENLLDQFLNAVVAHDPKRLPLSADVRYTENDQLLPVGDGFWNTAGARGSYKQVFTDPVTQQVGFIGSMREGTGLLLMSARLRVQLGRITEIETAYFRPGGGGPNDIAGLDKSTPEPFWAQALPAGRRPTRHELISIANSYFEGVQGNDGKGFYPFTDDCNRRENGALTTNTKRQTTAAPAPARAGGPPPAGAPGGGRAGGAPAGGFDAFALGCKPQLESGYYAVATRIHSRRFPIVDEERGIVFTYLILDMAGTVPEIKLTNGQTVSMASFSRPTSIEATEVFKIENGLIRGIEMIGASVPYHFNSAWSGGLSGK